MRDRKGEYRKELESFRKQGFVRARIDGELRELSEEIALAKTARHSIDVVVDRLVVKANVRPRIAESIEAALRLAGGLVRVDVGPGEREHLLSERNACPDCGVSYPEIAPRMFSFNSPHGACPACAGLGTRPEFDARRVVPDESKSLAEGAIAPWSGRRVPRYYAELLAGLAAHYGVSLETPWSKLPARAREGILHGSGGEEIPFRVTRRGRQRRVLAPLGRRAGRARAPLRGGLRAGARRARALPQREALRRLRRHPPAPGGARA